MTSLLPIELSHTVLFGCTRMELPLALPLRVGGSSYTSNRSAFGSKLRKRRFGPPSTIHSSPLLPVRMPLRRTCVEAAGGRLIFDVGQGLAIELAQPSAGALGNPAVAVEIDRHLRAAPIADWASRIRPRCSRAPPAARSVRGRRLNGSGLALAAPAAGRSCREISQHHLFLVLGERLGKRRALRIELHAVQHLLASAPDCRASARSAARRGRPRTSPR